MKLLFIVGVLGFYHFYHLAVYNAPNKGDLVY